MRFRGKRKQCFQADRDGSGDAEGVVQRNLPWAADNSTNVYDGLKR